MKKILTGTFYYFALLYFTASQSAASPIGTSYDVSLATFGSDGAPPADFTFDGSTGLFGGLQVAETADDLGGNTEKITIWIFDDSTQLDANFDPIIPANGTVPRLPVWPDLNGSNFDLSITGLQWPGSSGTVNQTSISLTYLFWGEDNSGGGVVPTSAVKAPTFTTISGVGSAADPLSLVFLLEGGSFNDDFNDSTIDSGASGLRLEFEINHPLSTTAVPEPSTVLLLATGLLGIACYLPLRRRTA